MASFSPSLPAVEDFSGLLKELLERAEDVKETTTVEPSLNKSDFTTLLDRVEESQFKNATTPELRKWTHAIAETAIRDTYNSILASTTITAPSFVKIWNLLDIVSFLAEREQCDIVMLFWLVEELLDSQTIAGCRKIFDYLESRRERITAKKFQSWNLVVLRFCTELLRRLSRAEDAAFCGRVFIFMFQSYPLGDKSSVNLRGEYHTENVTSYDASPSKESEDTPAGEKMDVDSEDALKPQPNGTASSTPDKDAGSKAASFSEQKTLTPDELYPIFWSLQESLNQPMKLFDPTKFAEFKKGLEATMATFIAIPSRARPMKAVGGVKRKRGEGEDDLANAYNPKYLTSRDLFELEISDLSFKRHILIQGLIVMEFLISLGVKARENLVKSAEARSQANEPPVLLNKSVMYAEHVLSDEDLKWVEGMKASIDSYLIQDKFFHRMVETVTARDKNWVRWKSFSCQSIALPPVPPEIYMEAKAAGKKATTNKRLRPNPIGSLDLNFLAPADDKSGLERLKGASRYQLPPLQSFKNKIETDDLDLDFETDPEKKNDLLESKASKTWRALRIAATTKFVAFDKIENDDKIGAIFEDAVKAAEVSSGDGEGVPEPSRLPGDLRPLVLSIPPSAGGQPQTLVRKLMEDNAPLFVLVAQHTTREPSEVEPESEEYCFVTKEKFAMLRDGDAFVEFHEFEGHGYGISRQAVENISARNRIPIIVASSHLYPYPEVAQQMKSNGFDARYVFIQPANMNLLDTMIRRNSEFEKLDFTEDEIQAKIARATHALKNVQSDELYTKVLSGDEQDVLYSELETYIFGENDKAVKVASTPEVAMINAAPEEPAPAKEVHTPMETDDDTSASPPKII